MHSFQANGKSVLDPRGAVSLRQEVVVWGLAAASAEDFLRAETDLDLRLAKLLFD